MRARAFRGSLLPALTGLLLLCVGRAGAQVEIRTYAQVFSSDETLVPFYDLAEDTEADESSIAGQRVSARASTCLDPCAVVPPFAAEAEAEARTFFGTNEIGLRTQSYELAEQWSYTDVAFSGSRWQDELTFTSATPQPPASIRATVRLRASWEHRACFQVLAYLYEAKTFVPGCHGGCCDCATVASVAGAWNRDDPARCEGPMPFGRDFLSPVPGFGEDDGDADVVLSLELPLILDSPIRFGVVMIGESGPMELSSLGSGVSAEVESLEVPAGVSIASAADALPAYVGAPEPQSSAVAATAFATLSWISARAARARRARCRRRRARARRGWRPDRRAPRCGRGA